MFGAIFLIGSTMSTLADRAVMDPVVAGQVKPVLTARFPLRGSRRAGRLKSGEQLGKITLAIG
jgi:hypothetical protein